MQKIVINKCYGGFSISPLAVKRLAELQNKPCYFFKRGSNFHQHVPASIDEVGGTMFWSAYTVPNPDEVAPSSDNWSEMTLAERQHSNQLWESITLSSRPNNRSDPLLIQVVEELGEKADGDCAELKIVEIPDGVVWEIDEYDGMESIDEVHQSWG